jgi:hypothetical protein
MNNADTASESAFGREAEGRGGSQAPELSAQRESPTGRLVLSAAKPINAVEKRNAVDPLGITLFSPTYQLFNILGARLCYAGRLG